MDFYKKIVKTKDINSVLSEKEYKCVSLQAISTEAIKENNKKTLKDLVEEINGHLTDLQAIYSDVKDPRNKEKCEKLIKQYEECLVKIVNNKFSDVVATITKQLENWETLTNQAIKENNLEELNELVDRMERNFEVMKEIPEVKRARNMENGDEKILEIINKYTGQLNKAMGHINAQKRIISGPLLLQEKLVEEKSLTVPETPSPLKSNKIVINEVEERLKQMRQKRLNRLSTFVDQQTKLSEDRSRENALKTPQSLSQLVEKVESEPAIKSNAAQYKANRVQEKVVRASEQTVFAKTEKKETEKIIEGALQGGGMRSNSFIKVATESIIDHTQSSSDHNNFRKGSVTRSFAERQIENARNQMEKPKIQGKQSNKTTPPRTPTQIRKIFNSLNSCVLGANVQKSIEDLPSEFSSHFERELKNVKLKTAKLTDGVEQEQNLQSTGKYLGFKDKEHFGEKDPPKAQEAIPVLPPKVPIEKFTRIGAKDSEIRKNPIEKSASQSQIATSFQESSQKSSFRKSLDYDAIIRPTQNPLENVTITVKRDSSTLPASEKYPFSTFRSSSDSTNAFENPIYAIANNTKRNSLYEDIESNIEESKRKIRKLSNDSNRFIVLEPMIAKLEFAIRTFKGLKRDDDYYWLDKLLSKYYVKVDEVTASTAFDEIEKQNLLERLKKASKDLEKRANKNEDFLKIILEEQVIMIGIKYGLA